MSIAFDAPSGSFVNPGTSHTVAHTCSGTNRALWVNVVGADVTDLITGCTYAGAPMTLVSKGRGNGRWNYLFLLLNPATGTNNIIASASASSYIEINGASYTGVAQSGPPEAVAQNMASGSATSRSQSVTTVADNSWVVGSAMGQSGAITAGAATTLRNTSLVGALIDSGGPVTPAGARALTVNAGANELTLIVATMAPAGGGGTSATANGATVTAAASILAGNASGQAGATAIGRTLTAAAALIAGAASGVINGTLNFQAAGLEFGRRTGLGTGTFALDAGASYRYTIHADALTLGAALHTSSAITLDTAGKLPNYVGSAVVPGTSYRIVAIRQADGEAAIFRMTAA